MSARVVHVNDKVSDAIYIGRSMPRMGLKASPLRNPFHIGEDGDRAEVILTYRRMIRSAMDAGNRSLIEAIIAVRDKPLACWCRHEGETPTPDNRCHGDVLIDILSRSTDTELRSMVAEAVTP